MTTKNYSLFLENKSQKFVNTLEDKNSPYKNLNLNQNHNSLLTDNFLSNGNISSSNLSKSHNTDYNFQYSINNNGYQKTNKNLCTTNSSSYLSNSKDKQIKRKHNESNSDANKSTLSLHILAYENSVDAINSEKFDPSLVINDTEKVVIDSRNKSGLCGTRKNAKNFLTNLSSKSNITVEIPRQQEEKATEPEIMQFKASQKLLKPNQLDYSAKENQKFTFLNLKGPTPEVEPSKAQSNPEKQQTVSYYIPPEFALTPPSSVEYRIKFIDAPPDSRGWNIERRQQQSFVTIGREPPVDLDFQHDSISRKHAVIQYGNGSSGPGWYIYDLGSSHGTFIDDEKIEAKQYIYLEEGSKVRIGHAKKYTFSITSTVTEVDPNVELQKISYTPPVWRLPVPEELNYQLEIINNGSIERYISLKNVLTDNSYATIGKPNNPVVTIIDKHPSVSRLHAVLQYGLLGKKYGWFLYDNGSSHGTKLNKAKLPPRYFAKVPVGSVFTLGTSKQLYSLTGVSYEDEEEHAKKAFAKLGLANNKSEEENKSISASEAKAYNADPVGWLTSYFENEGLSLEYSYAPGGGQNTICSIDLREVLETSEDTVVKGEGRGRDEAKKNAALAACQKIDSSSNEYQKSEFRTKRQEYEENDFYSSDEDEFYDRTGQLGERRKKRQQRYNEQGSENKSLTHEELVKQLKEAETTLENVKKFQEQISEEARTTKSLSAKFMLSSSRQKLLVAQTEVRRLSALVEATKPANIDAAFERSIKASTTTSKTVPIPDIVTQEKETTIQPDTVDDSSNKLSNKKMPEQPESSSSEIATTISDSIEKEEKQKEPEPKKRSAFGLIHRKDLQELKNEALSAKKRKVMKFDDDDFNDQKDDRDLKAEIQAEPEDNATWIPPQGQSGDGRTKLNDKFAGRY